MRALPSTRQRNPSSPTAPGVPPVPPEGSPTAAGGDARAAAPQSRARIDVRQVVTDRIVAMLEKGGNVFRERWVQAASRGMPRNGKTGAPYHGANVLLLWDAAIEHGYASNVWLTYKQASSLGAQVRRGEKAVMCAHFERRAATDAVGHDGDAIGDGREEGAEAETSARGNFLVCRPFWVFNAAQIDRFPAELADVAPAPQVGADHRAIEGAMRFIGGCRPDIRHGFERAAYAPQADRILMPDVARFTSPEAYCATVLHELVHWTGHESRLNRTFGQRFGDEAYAFEELVAELGCAFVLGHIGLVEATIEGHAGYLDSWLRVLRRDRSAIFTAARHAGEAYEYILARQMPASSDSSQGDNFAAV